MIISFADSRRYFLYREVTDMRKGFDSLCGVITGQFKKNPIDGDVFIFINRHRNRIKLLHWQGDGFAILYKRLESGTFEIPITGSDENAVELDAHTLQFIMQGVSLKSIKKRKRYAPVTVCKS